MLILSFLEIKKEDLVNWIHVHVHLHKKRKSKNSSWKNWTLLQGLYEHEEKIAVHGPYFIYYTDECPGREMQHQP